MLLEYTWRNQGELCFPELPNYRRWSYAGTNLGTWTRGKNYARGNLPLVIADGKIEVLTEIFMWEERVAIEHFEHNQRWYSKGE